MILRKFILLFFVFLLGGCLNSLTAQQYRLSSNSKRALKFYAEAEKDFGRRENQSAKLNLEKAVKADDDFIEAWLLLGDVNTELGEFMAAVEAYSIAIAIDSAFFPKAYVFIGNLNYTLGQYTDAVEYYSLFLSKFDSNSPSGKIALAGLEKASFAAKKIENPVCEMPVNLGKNINTSEEDYPNFTDPSAKSLVLTRKTLVDHDNTGRPVYLEKIYKSKKEKGSWDTPDALNIAWDEGLNLGGMNMSVDGRKMYFTGCNWPAGFGSCDIYVSYRRGNVWQNPLNLGTQLNSQWWDSQPILSSNGKELYFTSRRANGKGGADIWMSIMLKDGKWSPPVNLGDSINTSGNEMAPMLHPDGKTLYFSSDGHLGLGKYDLFVSKKDEAGRWSKAKNLGYPINTSSDEINLFINLKGDLALLSSNRPGGYGKTDIYSFTVYPEMAPEKVSFVKGIVSDKKTGQPVFAEIILTDLKTGNVKDSAYSDPITGEFLMVLQPKINYAFNILAKGYLFFSENYNLVDSLFSKPVIEEFKLTPLQPGERIVLQNVFFDFNSSELKPESFSELEILVELARSNPGAKLKIEGHTDNIGGSAYNLNLSTERAGAVYNYLLKNGIPATRMEFEGFGDTRPLSTNETEAGRAKNRRTEVRVL